MRGFPLCITGTIYSTKSGRNTVADDFILSLRRNIIRHTTNGQPSWEVFTGSIDLPFTGTTPNTRITTFKSVGDKTLGSGSLIGDANIYLQLFQPTAFSNNVSSLSLVALQDYSQVNNSGTGYTITASAATIPFSIYGNFKLEYALLVDEYEIILAIYQRNASLQDSIIIIGAGQLNRVYPEPISGIARIASGTSTTGTVVLQLDRDIRGTGSTPQLQVGQKVWIVNQTPSGSALVAPRVEIVHVSGITANTITVTGVLNQPYFSGSLVGYDPCPLYSIRFNGSSATPSAYTTTQPNGASVSLLGSANHQATLVPWCIDNNDTDGPSYDGYYRISPIKVFNSFTNFNGNRGSMGLLKGISKGISGKGSKLVINSLTGSGAVSGSYLCFAEIGGFSSMDLVIGPCIMTGAI
ncbi:MAG: hypothetical protein HC875_15260 [Anaerolineales bacterium]|nr:hypothetical protein [Anaerolineales bacterium]